MIGILIIISYVNILVLYYSTTALYNSTVSEELPVVYTAAMLTVLFLPTEPTQNIDYVMYFTNTSQLPKFHTY